MSGGKTFGTTPSTSAKCTLTNTREPPSHKLAQAAIKGEQNYVNPVVWGIADADKVLKDAEAKVARTRWVVCNNGDEAHPDVRARLVAYDLNTHQTGGFYASTPPLEAQSLPPTMVTTWRTTQDGRPAEAAFDVKKSDFHEIPRRNLHVYLPREPSLGTNAVAHLLGCVYGACDAGQIRQDVHAYVLVKLCFRRGVANPCCFSHPVKHISVEVHGDDLTALGWRAEVLWYEKGLADAFTNGVNGHLWESDECEKAILVLIRIARIAEVGLPYVGDPRDAEMLLKAFPEMNSVTSPGVREDDVHYDATLGQEIAANQPSGDNDSITAINCSKKNTPQLKASFDIKQSINLCGHELFLRFSMGFGMRKRMVCTADSLWQRRNGDGEGWRVTGTHTQATQQQQCTRGMSNYVHRIVLNNDDSNALRGSTRATRHGAHWERSPPSFASMATSAMQTDIDIYTNGTYKTQACLRCGSRCRAG